MLFYNAEVVGFLSSPVPVMPSIFTLAVACILMLFFAGKRILFSRLLRRLFFITPALFFLLSAQAQNAIVTENALPGNPISEWGVTSSADFRNVNLNGYATDISVNKGSTVHFKIDGQAGVPFTIKIYRMGYYGGLGARFQADLGSFPGIKQPAGTSDPVTGLVDCGNWTESASWLVPATAVSGFYIVKLQSAGGINNIVFIVRDDASTSKIFFQANDATWQAYNAYGGSNVYNGTTGFPSGHAVKVSYNRPFFIYNTGFLTNNFGSDWYMNDSYPMIRWLERNGYDMSYTTNVDVARSGGLLLNHKIFVTNGHDEYWSKEQRDAVEAARNAGVNLAFFSGNEVYWKTRWEADGSGTNFRTMVCYKEGLLADGSQGEATCGFKCDVSAPTVWTGLWRTGQAFDAPLPENALTGQISWDGTAGAIQVPDSYKNLRLWRNTSVALLAAGQTATLAPNTLGYEWDYEQFPATYPPARITMSKTVLNGHTHKLSLYKYYPSGALVFGAGTVQWGWGLDDQHFGGTGNLVSKDMQQATVNLFADMGVQPGSLQSDLVAAAASTDVTPPVSVITTPVTGASVTINTSVTISGTATDAGGAVAGVEVSVDGGLTWQPATGTNNWTFSWNPLSPGTYTIKSRAFDDSGNLEDASGSTGKNVITITLSPKACPCVIFTTQAPTETTGNDGQAIELGVKFRTVEAGFITGIRFYKTTGNTGTHTGELYSSTGTRLAQAVFTNETATGWQTVSFSTPVAVTANTTYVASYFSSAGNYVGTTNYFTTAVVNSPMTALADGADGPNGLFDYSVSPRFPTSTPRNKKPNYWVDAIFATDASLPVANAGANQTITLPVSSVTLNGSGSTGTITSYAWTKISGPNTPVITTPTTVSTTVTGLVQGVYIFQLSVNGGPSTSLVTVTVLAGVTSNSIFTTQTPLETTGNDGQGGIELGVKFRSSTAGFVTGARFYKTTGNTGTHTGELYSSTGTRLAQAIFTNETTTGWQTVSFSTPIAITANTTYVASYFSSAGNYVGTANYFTSAIVNGPLSALADGTDGPNGLYDYTNSPKAPSSSPQNRKPNYWVDVVFSGSSAPVANAGPNQTITLPASSVTLDGSGSTGTISSYTWSKISGPNTPLITAPAAISTTVTGLIQGTYIFQLSVNAGISLSQVTIIVNPIPPPTANAGTNQTITLPNSSTTLDGSGSTGTITSYSWTKISGPNTPVITTPTTVSTTVTGLVQGVYIFQLSVNGGPSTSLVTVTVLAGVTSNSIFTTQTPLETTGNDGQGGIELGVKFRSSTAGFVTGARFYKTTGNTGTHTGELYSSTGTRLAQAIFTNETTTGWQTVSFSTPIAVTANTTYIAAYFSSAGNYVGTANYFTSAIVNGPLSALADGTDGPNGLYDYTNSPKAPSSSPQNRKPNYWVDVVFSGSSAPVANAGPNQTITLPASSVTLDGSGSTGTISSYTWSKISGPNTPVITTPNTISTTVTGLVQGTYIFQLSVNAGVSTSQVTIVVNPVPPPTANAGSNQTIILPVSTVTLDGSGSTGTISSYSWTKVSGPNTPIITTPTAVSTTVTGLVQGTYIFQLSLNVGISTSQVTVTVLAAGLANSIFTTQTPLETTGNDGQGGIELGVKFQSSTAGFITGVRFYKTTGNTGTHTGELYSSAGTRLAQAVFSGETASGWQTVLFASPVAITANTTYVAAYFSSAGNYVGTPNYFTTAVVHGSLIALADGTDGPNGLYDYTNIPKIPSSSPQNRKPNYWVDVVFSTSGQSGQSTSHLEIAKAEDKVK